MITPDSSIDTAKLTPAQASRLEAITLALNVLDEAEVSFTFFASPDTPAADMKVMHGQRLTYSKDLKTIQRETTTVRKALLWSTLKTLSVGLAGGICVYSKDGSPLAMFQDGKALPPPKAPSTGAEPKVSA